MAYTQEFLNYVNDQLSVLDDVATKKMFGGVGFFREGVMFGMIGDGRFRLRVDDENRAAYEAYDMGPLVSKSKGKSMPYYEVPVAILDDRDALKKWAELAFAVAVRNSKK